MRRTKLLKELCQHINGRHPGFRWAWTESDVPADVIAKEKEFAKNQAIEQGKPANIAEKNGRGQDS